ncbi:MAG: type II secretion system protein J [Oligoflexales bacterium]
MLQRKIKKHHEQAFTILEVVVAVGISSIVMISGFHFLSLQSHSVARLQERAEVRSISQQISRAIQSGYILKASALENPELRNCLEPEGICTISRRSTSFVLQGRGGGIIYAGERQGSNTKFYKLPPTACQSRQIVDTEKKLCRLQAVTTFKARCPLDESGERTRECTQASDLLVTFELIRESDGKRLYRGRSVYPVLSKDATALQSDTSCPPNSVKITRKRGQQDDHSECECKPGFKKTLLPFGGIACRSSDSTACPQGDQGSVYHGFEIDEETRKILPKCSNVFCKTFTSKRYDINANLGADNLQQNLKTMETGCPQGSWMSGIWIDKCEAGLCFFKKDGSRCYRDPDKTTLGTQVSCDMKYRCCAKDPEGIQALQSL